MLINNVGQDLEPVTDDKLAFGHCPALLVCLLRDLLRRIRQDCEYTTTNLVEEKLKRKCFSFDLLPFS